MVVAIFWKSLYSCVGDDTLLVVYRYSRGWPDHLHRGVSADVRTILGNVTGWKYRIVVRPLQSYHCSFDGVATLFSKRMVSSTFPSSHHQHGVARGCGCCPCGESDSEARDDEPHRRVRSTFDPFFFFAFILYICFQLT